MVYRMYSIQDLPNCPIESVQVFGPFVDRIGGPRSAFIYDVVRCDESALLKKDRRFDDAVKVLDIRGLVRINKDLSVSLHQLFTSHMETRSL